MKASAVDVLSLFPLSRDGSLTRTLPPPSLVISLIHSRCFSNSVSLVCLTLCFSHSLVSLVPLARCSVFLTLLDPLSPSLGIPLTCFLPRPSLCCPASLRSLTLSRSLIASLTCYFSHQSFSPLVTPSLPISHCPSLSPSLTHSLSDLCYASGLMPLSLQLFLPLSLVDVSPSCYCLSHTH